MCYKMKVVCRRLIAGLKEGACFILGLIDLRKWLPAISLGSIAGFMDHQITYIEQDEEEGEEGGTNTDFYGGISRAGKRKRV